VTAACTAAAGHTVIGLDENEATVNDLRNGKPPVAEPGLGALVAAELATGRLGFTIEAAEAVRDAEVLWIAFDTPVDRTDRADTEFVRSRVAKLLPRLPPGCVVLISSQMPVGTTAGLEAEAARRCPDLHLAFAVSPENLRLGKALEVFQNPDRVVIGTRNAVGRPILEKLFRPITERIEWMSVESAEMTKHAINAFLAISVTFINELAVLCEKVGADAKEVERGLKTESRIGPRAYLGPGAAFAGGTLGRDLQFLDHLGKTHQTPLYLVAGAQKSNRAHKDWSFRRVVGVLHNLEGLTIAVWGLTYKPGTNTLRRSLAIELCRKLRARGAVIRAYDPALERLPSTLAREITLTRSAEESLEGASALIVATEWPVFRQIPAGILKASMRRALVIDASRFLGNTIGLEAGIEYWSVGRVNA
jgi:UDPglucose 6-dehydrogenase